MKYYQGFSFENRPKKLETSKEETVKETMKQAIPSQKGKEYINVKEHRSKIWKTAIAACLLTAFLFIGFGLGMNSAGYFSGAGKISDTKQPDNNGTQTPAPIADITEGNSISGIVDRTGGAVVAIETESRTQNPWSGSDDQFWRYFGRTPDRGQTVQGLGSGFLISADGYILTNNHVIAGANSIRVQLLGIEEPLTAKVIGADASLDLAVLKIEAAHELPVIALGDSDNISVGDWVVAIGNPYGLDHTVTMGVISAKERPLTIDNQQFKNLLQTDASINPGNSGGPLLNLKGEVIGINTAITSQGQGLGFAIPINTVREVLQELIEQGKVSRPWLGVSITDITQEIADYLRTNITEGVVIAEVMSNSPAQQAGLRQGDIILEINKQKIKKSEEVTELIGGSQVGAQIEILIIRNNAYKTISATLAEK